MNQYITSADITHVHLAQFPPIIIEPYIQEANLWLEDLARQMGVNPAQIDVPVGIVTKRCLTSYVNMRFAQDSIGVNNVDISMNDMYRVMFEDWQKSYENLENQITPSLLISQDIVSPMGRSVSMGKTYRRS